ncbi:DUF4129 domain-containing protein [Hymenobacter cavernae]|uniref:Protein-glutamine gamma-glutamyltransferase-like C-terminal domain-containing protein n=1 Tax=Hymenobacter cavernae TaxID=2044852 RepID=A0ABQ1TIZ5_9BACT|nr:DUF4129 domain-containing protein [Hymenobacter cavernae]GGE94437.1 hypothetical protein GCM10011383_01430 [Hymenobacter cavernae]
MLLLASLGEPLVAESQSLAPRQLQLAAAPEQVSLRRPTAERLKALRSQRELQYEMEPVPQTSAWDSFWYRFRRWLGRLLNRPAYQHGWRYLVYGAFLVAFVFIVLRLLKVDLTGAFGRNPQRMPLAYTTEGEDIHAVDFPARIAEAEAAGDYRLAVRLGFLSVLKQLTDRGLLTWRPEKTNADYLAEVPAGPLHAAFGQVARQFEYAWYGELPLTAAQYALAREARLALLQLLTPHAA